MHKSYMNSRFHTITKRWFANSTSSYEYWYCYTLVPIADKNVAACFFTTWTFLCKTITSKKISIQSRSFHFISGGRHILLNKPFLITSSVDFCRFLKHFRVKIRRPIHGALLHLSRACPTMRILYAPVAPRWGITHQPRSQGFSHLPSREKPWERGWLPTFRKQNIICPGWRGESREERAWN